MKKLIILPLNLFIIYMQAQNVGIGTTTPAFKLDVNNGSINTDSLYRINSFPVLSIKGTQNLFIGAEAGLVNTGSQNVFTGYHAGFSNSTGIENSFSGTNAGWMNTTGSSNSFFGFFAGGGNTIGAGNSFFGRGAGSLNTGDYNSFYGVSTGAFNTTGGYNAFYGFASGFYNTNGSGNVFFGTRAGLSNTTGYSNVAIGYYSLYANTTISNLVAVGDSALYNNGTGASGVFGTQNVAVGSKALLSNTTGFGNTALGMQSIYKNISGTGNTGIGYRALSENLTGSTNTAIGYEALFSTTSDNNVGIGYLAGLSNAGGSYNTLIGSQSNVNSAGLVNATAIGGRAIVSQSNTLVLGSINGINGATSSTNVGIGLTSPGAPFEVKTTGGLIARFGGNNGMYIALNENDVYRGYFGSYSGLPEDVDFGTGSGNTTGSLNLTIQAVPKLTISPSGAVDIKNELTRTNKTGSANLVPIAYGSIRADGVIRTGTGNFTCTKYATGAYAIAVSAETYSPDTYIVQATVLDYSVKFIMVSTVVTYPGSFVVFIQNPSITAADADFTFVLFKP
jgi:hypothetical protein